MFGRSNVGKSSLINTLLQRKGVARISKTPGKTRAANFFRINERFHLVDMPGYGYAKAAPGEVERFAKLFDQYLADDTRNNALVQLIDTRHKPTADDIQSIARLKATGRPMCVVFNKVDKVSKGQLNQQIGAALAEFELPGETAVVPFSSVTGEGKRELWLWIRETLGV